MTSIRPFIHGVGAALAGPYKLAARIGVRLEGLRGHLRLGALIPNRGRNCHLASSAILKCPENLSLGDGVIIGDEVVIGAGDAIRLGDHVRLSRGVIIETSGLDFAARQPPYEHISKAITIGAGVWVGSRAIILGGVTIGDNAVIAAGAVVTRSVPANTIVAGNPAVVVKELP